LIPKANLEKWLKHLRKEYPTVAFKASTQTQRTNLGRSKVSSENASSALLQGSESLGGDTLVQLLKNYCRNAGIKTSITVGVVGFPNVGKSSLINSLKRSKVCDVGGVAGVTKTAKHIILDKNIHLIDSPGIVFGRTKEDGSNAQELMLRNAVKVEAIEDPVAPGEFGCTGEKESFVLIADRFCFPQSATYFLGAAWKISFVSTKFRHLEPPTIS